MVISFYTLWVINANRPKLMLLHWQVEAGVSDKGSTLVYRGYNNKNLLIGVRFVHITRDQWNYEVISQFTAWSSHYACLVGSWPQTFPYASVFWSLCCGSDSRLNFSPSNCNINTPNKPLLHEMGSPPIVCLRSISWLVRKDKGEIRPIRGSGWGYHNPSKTKTDGGQWEHRGAVQPVLSRLISWDCAARQRGCQT